ncbi:MAG: C40 family peptidase [Bacteroidetes bacterium]|nr:C40 family peptidase [Bacteroidota bacterium]MBT6686982.1 C40 family peptidase [Bacteroidota bacterium]MBT7142416.1 C40 family peptidase [Bacteroidota bacterium]MBT7490597.1 C40 family peptidase [Bacteroidota bacterium]
MKIGISKLSIIPIRKEPSEKSEMISQLLFGETYHVLGTRDNWLQIKTYFDDYIGWIDAKMHSDISTYSFNYMQNKNLSIISNSMIPIIDNKEKIEHTIVAGSSIPNFNGKRSFRFDGRKFKFRKSPLFQNGKNIRSSLIETSKLYLNAPYLWGGRTPFGIDCSGFVQLVAKINNIFLPRDASQQIVHGSVIDFINEANTGDLVFFDNEAGEIIHVGILLNSKQIIHASGKVRIDNIDHHGIYNVDTKRYTHQLRVIKNIVE